MKKKKLLFLLLLPSRVEVRCVELVDYWCTYKYTARERKKKEGEKKILIKQELARSPRLRWRHSFFFFFCNQFCLTRRTLLPSFDVDLPVEQGIRFFFPMMYRPEFFLLLYFDWKWVFLIMQLDTDDGSCYRRSMPQFNFFKGSIIEFETRDPISLHRICIRIYLWKSC